MSKVLFNNENTNGVLSFPARDTSFSHRPVILFIKVGLIIILCEATTISVLNLLAIKSVWGNMLDPILLTVFGTICLYRFIVSPMNRTLKIKEKAESRLELYRGLIDQSNDAVFVADPGTAKLLDVNYRACITLGYLRAELLNMTALEVDETFTDGSAWTELIRHISSCGYEFLQRRHKRKDGSTFPVEVNANLINWGGRNYMVAMARDITKREHVQIQLKESETKFRKVAECMKDAIVMMGPKGEISFWNPAAEKIFGYSAGEIIGNNLHEMLVPERFRDAFQKGFSGFQKTGKGNAVGKTLNLTAIRKDGSELNMELSISPVRLEGIWHAVGVVRDTSQRTAKETDLAVSGSAAEEAA